MKKFAFEGWKHAFEVQKAIWNVKKAKKTFKLHNYNFKMQPPTFPPDNYTFNLKKHIPEKYRSIPSQKTSSFGSTKYNFEVNNCTYDVNHHNSKVQKLWFQEYKNNFEK